MEISYKLERFEGPLDLLLYLIERDRVDIRYSDSEYNRAVSELYESFGDGRP